LVLLAANEKHCSIDGILLAFCFPALAQNPGNASPVPGAGLPVIVLVAIAIGSLSADEIRAKMTTADTSFHQLGKVWPYASRDC
jgi:hypothetical protein